MKRKREEKLIPVADPAPERTPEACRNCGHVSAGKFCPQCGQNFTDVRRPFRQVFHDFMSLFNIDSSIFRTIGPFLFRPGSCRKSSSQAGAGGTCPRSGFTSS